MKRALVIAVMCVVGCRPKGDSSIVVGGHVRSYELFVPVDKPGMALVVALHGGLGTGKKMEIETKLDAIAAREQFVVVYPDGIGNHWVDGRPGIGEAGVDDVAFIRALVDDIASRYSIDRKRVFATGISNGGMMSYRLACDAADMFAAIAPVAGNVDVAIAPACHPKQPVSVLAINGDADPIVPYGGGGVSKTRGDVLGAIASTQLFSTADGCGPAAAPVDEPDVDPGDDSRTRRSVYACAPPIGVELLTIVGGGHTWPGGSQYLPKAVIGPVSRDFSASERAWQFFVDHARR